MLHVGARVCPNGVLPLCFEPGRVLSFPANDLLPLVQSSHKTKIKIPNVTIFISWLSLCVFSPDPPVQLLSDIEALGDTPPVEEVGGEPGEQPGQPPDPPGLVRTCTSRPGKQQARIKGY